MSRRPPAHPILRVFRREDVQALETEALRSEVERLEEEKAELEKLVGPTLDKVEKLVEERVFDLHADLKKATDEVERLRGRLDETQRELMGHQVAGGCGGSACYDNAGNGRL